MPPCRWERCSPGSTAWGWCCTTMTCSRTYLGWDTEKDRKVQVEEFFPGILKRAEDGRGIMLISAESKTLFRTMASDLHDRWKRLMEVNHKAMLKTLVLALFRK